MSAVREITLRRYQEEAIQQMRDLLDKPRDPEPKWRKIIFVLPTGGGKTICAMHLIVQALRLGKRVWFIVDRVTLVKQTSDEFFAYGIDHGIIQGNNELTDYAKPVQIVSAQTLANRDIRLKPHLVIHDEAHCQHKAVSDLIARCDTARVIGLTATPFTAGMANQWDGLVNSTTTNKLIAMDPPALVPLRIKACVAPDMADVPITSMGEYQAEEAGSQGVKIIGDVVSTWEIETKRMFGGPVKTILFSPSVKHGEEACRQFAEKGYNFQQLSYHDTEPEKDEIIQEFRRPDSAIHGLVSCAVLTKGFNVPDVKVGISCRPYRKSLSSHIQEMGRVMRPAPGKTFGLWICHSENVIRFAQDVANINEYGVESLSSAAKQDSKPREPSEKVRKEMFCGDCAEQMPPKTTCCPACGWERPARNETLVVPGVVRDIDTSLAGQIRPRAGLRAPCLNDSRRMFNACLVYTLTNGSSKRTEADHRKWACGIWKGIYPDARLPVGAYEATPDFGAVTNQEMDLIGREVRNFRKKAGGRPQLSGKAPTADAWGVSHSQSLFGRTGA